jgi:hypothetical protein
MVDSAAPGGRGGLREFEVTLPIGYTDENGERHRLAAIRKMTGNEEAILADRKYQRNGGKLVTDLLASCVIRIGDLPRVNAAVLSALYSVDRNFLLIRLRAVTFGSELQARYTCPSCGENISVMEDLDELPVRTLEESDEPDRIQVELEDGWLDRDGSVHTSLTLRLPTGEDEEAVANQLRQNPSLGKNALLSRCLLSLGDVPRHRLEALGPKILADLSLTDRRMIDRAINQNAPGIDLVRPIECPFCGRAFNATLDLTNFLALE